MPVESWTPPEDVPSLAAQAMAEIDAALVRLDAAGREAFWAAIRKCYNTPYNDPAPRKPARDVAPPGHPIAVEIASGGEDEPRDLHPAAAHEADLAALVAMPAPAAFGTEHHPG